MPGFYDHEMFASCSVLRCVHTACYSSVSKARREARPPPPTLASYRVSTHSYRLTESRAEKEQNKNGWSHASLFWPQPRHFSTHVYESLECYFYAEEGDKKHLLVPGIVHSGVKSLLNNHTKLYARTE